MRAAFAAARDHRGELRRLPAWALYRLSGRRAGRDPDLYRLDIPAQRIALRNVAGMTAASERAYFAWHAREVFRGQGEIVDLGAWVGSTTASLARGLSRNRRPAAAMRKVHAFDRFLWEDWMDGYADQLAGGPYRPGDSFISEFERAVGPWRDRVDLHAGDLLAERWSEAPIEALLIDAMKSWPLAGHILAEFLPHLVPEHGFVIHQDFSNMYTPWIHLATYRLREVLQPVKDVPESETLVFRRHGSEALPKVEMTRASFDPGEIRRAFAHSLGITSPAKHAGIRAARVMLAVYDHDDEWAAATVSELESQNLIDPWHAMAIRQEIGAAGPRESGPD